MKTLILALAGLVLVPAALAQQCICKPNAIDQAWCSSCKDAVLCGVKITNEKLFNALQGKEVKAEEIAKTCKSCATALKDNGFCSACKVWFQGDKMYTSPVAARLAAGETLTEEKIAKCPCAECKKAIEGADKSKWSAFAHYCEPCKGGVVAGHCFKGKDIYDNAAKAIAILVKANDACAKCEGCALAMVSDGTCDHCKVSFKDGKMVATKTGTGM